MKNYLIVGGGGLVGNALVQNICDDPIDCNVFVTDRIPPHKVQYSNSKCKYFTNDELQKLFDCYEFECMILMAFPRNVTDDLWAPGIDFCLRVLNLARNGKVKRVVHISSQSVYGLKRTEAATEESKVNLFSPYTTGKYCIEQYVNNLFFDRPHTNIRLSTIIASSTEERVVNKLVRQIINNKEIAIKSGEEIFSFLDVRDAAEALKILLLSTCDWEELYNIGSSESYDLWTIALNVSEIGKQYGFDPKLIRGNEHICLNNTIIVSKFERTFRWKAKYRLNDSIRTMF